MGGRSLRGFHTEQGWHSTEQDLCSKKPMLTGGVSWPLLP
jgi:hypothetical protein